MEEETASLANSMARFQSNKGDIVDVCARACACMHVRRCECKPMKKADALVRMNWIKGRRNSNKLNDQLLWNLECHKEIGARKHKGKGSTAGQVSKSQVGNMTSVII